MLKESHAFSGFSVKDLEEAHKFYGETLGLDCEMTPMGLQLKTNGSEVFVYQKDNHEPATFTVLNFVVDDIDKAVEGMKGMGITFEQYRGMTGADGIARGKEAKMGPDIAWFKDPAGNVLSVLCN